MIKYADVMVGFEEIPKEVSLIFSITSCPYKCPGCHSSYLQEDGGFPLESIFEGKLKLYEGLCTCVLFMGGDDEHQVDELQHYMGMARLHKYKVALYSGADKINKKLLKYLDYYKTGHYDQSLGGLKSPNTNQRLYKVEGNHLKDITQEFWRK